MKYINTDRLIAEIERRKKEIFEIGGDTFENRWVCGSLDGIKAFAISLQQEQSEEVDFEKELKNERTKLLDAFGPMNGEQCLAIRNFARHFYELVKTARKEESK